MNWFQRYMVNRQERITGEDLDFMRVILEVTPGLFWKFGGFTLLLNHRKHCPKDAWHIARIAATYAEDCGPCVQTCVTLARRDGVRRDLIKAAIDGGTALPEGGRIAYNLGRSVAKRLDDVEAWRLQATRLFGEHGANELAVAIATAQVFPALKRGLGYAQSCALVTLDI